MNKVHFWDITYLTDDEDTGEEDCRDSIPMDKTLLDVAIDNNSSEEEGSDDVDMENTNPQIGRNAFPTKAESFFSDL